jgi:TPP-dependent pyruvate/acetoin dehydrogenase alpha subunit
MMSHETDQKTLAEQFYATMLRARRFEEEAFEFYKKGMMPGMAHLYLGEEAVAEYVSCVIGACWPVRGEAALG